MTNSIVRTKSLLDWLNLPHLQWYRHQWLHGCKLLTTCRRHKRHYWQHRV